MRRNTRFLSVTLALAAIVLSVGVVRAQDQPPAPPDSTQPPPQDPSRGVARISLVNGEINVRHGDTGDWVAGAANAPLVADDHIAAGPSSRAEVQFDSGDFLRLAANTEVHLAQLEVNRYQVQVGRGTVDFSELRAVNADIEIDTVSVSVRPRQRGNYRITVLDNGQTEITVRAGQAEIFTPRGVESVGAGQTMLVRGDPSNPEFQVVAAMAMDDWDRWNSDRDRRLDTAGNNVYNRYVSPDIAGAQDTEGYGQWNYAPDYGGYVWAPQQAPGWAPYQNGRWAWEDYYGWTWVGAEPWGWAPYHYGRWFFNAGYGGWCWWPGPIRAHYGWAPAYVGFFGFGGGGFGFGFGFGNVGWVPLAPFERFHAWWGPGFGRGGFYGGRTTFVNNVNVYSTYRNARVMNGVTAVNSRDFAAGRFNNRVAAGANELRSAGVVNGRLGITPGAQHMRFADRAVNNVPRGSTTNQHFFTPSRSTTMPGSSAQRGFSTPQRSFGNAPSTSGAAGAGGWRRFGTPGGGAAPGAMSRGNAPSTGGANGWQRFGSPGYNSAPRQSFGGSAAPQYNRPSVPQYNRPSAPPQYSRPNPAPQYNRPSAPQYSRPSAPPQYNRPSAPQYSRPSAPQYSRPSGGYSAPSHSSGGGGGHPSAPSHGGGGGGGGGHHR